MPNRGLPGAPAETMPDDSPLPKTPLRTFVNLSVMMFLLFFVWGAWLVTLGSYMAEREMSGLAIGWAYSTGPAASILMPFFIGFLADRYFNAERLQGILLLIAGAAMFLVPRFASPESWPLFVACLFLHTLCYMPTLGLSNTICLKHLTASEREYPRVRVFATLGWIVAGLVVSFVFQGEKDNTIFYLAGTVSFAVGIFTFFLPATPPAATQSRLELRQLIGKDTWPHFKNVSFSVFMFGSLLACIAFYPYWPLAAPFIESVGIERTAATLSLAQVCELFVLALVLPWALTGWGIKTTLLIGIASWIARYLLFTYASGAGTFAIGASVLAILLHGFAYDFVFVSGYLYVDKSVREETRAQAQALLVVFTQGVGFLIGSQLLVGNIHPNVTEDGSLASWGRFWLIPAIYLTVVLVALARWFRPPAAQEEKTAESDENAVPA